MTKQSAAEMRSNLSVSWLSAACCAVDACVVCFLPISSARDTRKKRTRAAERRKAAVRITSWRAVLGVDLLLRVNEQLLEDRDVSLSRFDRPEVLLCPDAIIVDLSNDDSRLIG